MISAPSQSGRPRTIFYRIIVLKRRVSWATHPIRVPKAAHSCSEMAIRQHLPEPPPAGGVGVIGHDPDPSCRHSDSEVLGTCLASTK